MADVEFIKNVAIIAAPLTKAVVDTWITPKLKDMRGKWLKDKKMDDHFFANQFEAYLNEKYKTYSILNILAFRNQQRWLEDLYIPLTLRLNIGPGNSREYKIEGYEDDLIPYYKKVLVTDTAGMGKSTLSKKLFLSVIEKNKGIPIFIELRRLSKERKIIDEIYRELALINEELDKDFIRDLLKKGDFILFLDGYDEIAEVDKNDVTEDIQRFINSASNNYYFLTSRPEGSLASFGQFQELTIKPLSREEAYTQLKKYDNNGELSLSLIEKINDEQYRSIWEFLKNPLLVSLLFTAYEYKHTIPLKKHVFYRQVYDALFEAHDLTKGDYYQREKHSGLSVDDFHTVMRYIAFICLKKDKIEFTKDEILEIIKAANVQCEVIDFEEHKILRDLLSTVPLFVNEGIYYKWTHKSIYEYFAAQFIYSDSDDKRSKILKSLTTQKNSKRFSNIIDIYSNVDYKSFKNEVVRCIVENFLKYCKSTYNDINVDISLMRERQEICFEQEYIVVQSNSLKEIDKEKFSSIFGNDHINECFRLVRKQSNQPFGKRVSSLDYSNYPSNAIILEIDKSLQNSGSILATILYILKRKGDILVKNIEFVDNNVQEIHLEKQMYYVDDKKGNPLNSVENFKKINSLIKFDNHGLPILNYDECIKFRDNLNDKEKQSHRDDFLSI